MPINNIGITVSLGTVCATSTYLHRNHLKKFSCPFDWIFAAPAMVEDCLRDDFAKFLDRKYYCKTEDHKGSGHTVYGLRIFNHHTPYLSDVDYQYFQRCVERFRKVLANPSPKLFLITSVNNEYSYDLNQIERLNELLSQKTSNYHLLVIYCKVSDSLPRIVKEMETETVSIFKLRTHIESNGIDIGNDNDTLNYQSILSSFNFDMRHLISSGDL